MMSSGMKMHFKQKIILRMTYELIIQNRLFGTFHFFIVCIRLVLLFIFNHIMYQCTFFGCRSILNYSPISFLNLTVPEHIVQAAESLTGLGKNHKPTYRSIQSVSYTYKHITGFIILLFQILFNSLRKRCVSSLITLNNFRGGFIYYYYMIVFVNYSHRNIFIKNRHRFHYINEACARTISYMKITYSYHRQPE